MKIYIVMYYLKGEEDDRFPYTAMFTDYQKAINYQQKLRKQGHTVARSTHTFQVTISN